MGREARANQSAATAKALGYKKLIAPERRAMREPAVIGKPMSARAALIAGLMTVMATAPTGRRR